jgi:hypothetical protein
MSQKKILKKITKQNNSELLSFWTFSIVLYSRNEKTRRFGNWICFRPQIQFPKRRVFLFLEYRTMEKAQKPSNSDTIHHRQNPLGFT